MTIERPSLSVGRLLFFDPIVWGRPRFAAFAPLLLLIMLPIVSAVGIASGIYHAMLTGAALIGIAAACPSDPEACVKARSMATHSSIAVVGCIALSAVAIRRAA